jgi:hypothetical protein
MWLRDSDGEEGGFGGIEERDLLLSKYDEIGFGGLSAPELGRVSG